jgi:hypothetical protein
MFICGNNEYINFSTAGRKSWGPHFLHNRGIVEVLTIFNLSILYFTVLFLWNNKYCYQVETEYSNGESSSPNPERAWLTNAPTS